MSFTRGNTARVYAAENHLSTVVQSVGAGVSRRMFDVTTLVSVADEMIPDTRRQATIEVTALLDDSTAAGSSWDVLTGALTGGNTVPVSVLAEGTVVAGRAWVGDVHTTDVRPAVTRDAAAALEVTMQVTGDVGFGQVLDVTAAGTATADGTAVDYSATGVTGVAAAHVTACTGGGTVTVEIEGSASGTASWASLGTVCAVDAPGSGFLELTAPPRYLRAAYTVAGSATFDLVVTAAHTS